MKKLNAVSFFKSEELPTVFMFHGYGADANDLSVLAHEIQTKSQWNWIFPGGPIKIPIGPNWTGSAWWNIDINRWQNTPANGDYDLSNETSPEAPKTREQVLNFIADHKIPWNKIVLGGFSQGGMLAADIYLHAPETPKGLLLFSTALVNKPVWKELVPKRAGGTFYISHGKSDPVIHVNNSQRLFNLLQQGGLKGKLELFDGVHSIPPQVIKSAGQYLDSLTV
ncbi:MAG: serine esterase [Bdellovibrionota bacterium]